MFSLSIEWVWKEKMENKNKIKNKITLNPTIPNQKLNFIYVLEIIVLINSSLFIAFPVISVLCKSLNGNKLFPRKHKTLCVLKLPEEPIQRYKSIEQMSFSKPCLNWTHILQAVQGLLELENRAAPSKLYH